MISDDPVLGKRPSISLTWDRRMMELAAIPRITHWPVCPDPAGRLISTTHFLGYKLVTGRTDGNFPVLPFHHERCCRPIPL